MTTLERIEKFPLPAESPRLGPKASSATAFAATFLAFAALARHGVDARGLVDAFLCAVLVLLAAIDIDRRLLPNRIVLPATALTLAAQMTLFPGDRLEWPLAALGAAGFFAVGRILSRGGLGMGDVKLGLLLGAGLGTQVLPALALGTLAAGVFGVALIARRGGSARKAAIPFGPFLAAGAIAVLLLG